jgi:thioredoxin-like negative regulator of GroEL
MSEKSPKRLRLEASLAEDPADQFLRYGLALQCLREGDRAEGRERLLALIADHPEESVAAYQQLGQSYMESGEVESAREIFKTGILKANARKDWHAAGEMEGFLGQLG